MRKQRIGRIKKRLFVLALAMGAAFSLPACGEKSGDTSTEEVRSESTVFSFQGKNITLGEVYLYALPVVENYEKTYGDDIWRMKVTLDGDKEQDMQTLTRKDVIENIVKVKVLLTKAETYGISLSEDDREKAETETEKFWKNLTDEQIEQMELTRDMVFTCMEENMLAAKVYDAMMDEAGIEISDEQARETTYYDLYFPCYTENADGTVKPMDAAQKQEEYDKAVQAYNSLISPLDENTERDPSTLATYYGLKDSGYYTRTPEEIRETYGKEISEMLYKLEDGSCSLVTETEYGYHIFFMKALTDREATDRKKAKMERESRNTFFDKKYEVWLREVDANYHYEDSVDFEVYNRIVF